jgi:hypothetical protein
MRSWFCLALSLSLAALAACGSSQRFALQGTAPPAREVTGLEGKRVAVVLQHPQVQTAYHATTDGTSFVVYGVDAFFGESIKAWVGPKLARLEFFMSPPANEFDAYVYPLIELDIDGLYEKTCHARHTVVVLDAAGREIARSSGEGAASFRAVTSAEPACRSAVAGAFSEPAWQAFAAIARLEPVRLQPDAAALTE